MQIALYGLGIIGSIWSRNLAADGHQVRAWNRTAKPDHPQFQADILRCAAGAQLHALVVADGPAVHAVLDRILPVLVPGAVVANHATIGIDEVQAIARRVRAAGGRFLDLPFTGSKIAAERRQTVYFIGDDDASWPLVEAAYRPLTRAVVPCGKVGEAMTVKLAMNLIIAGTYQALAEGFRLAQAAGVSPETFFAALDLNVAKSGVADLKKPKLVARDWSPQFSVKHMHKDLRHALALAAARQVALPMTTTVRAAYEQAEGNGLGEADFAVLYEAAPR
jgi:3-hydroxyisobutyrate dehydrogenase-like beta-hydroxyacid dehydrogenase